MSLQSFEWKDKPALIEHLFPVQKISAEAYKEQMAGSGKTLTALGSYWKGRKPLILNKACILGSLLPLTDNPLKDLEVFEMLMGMDAESMEIRISNALPVSKHDEVTEYLDLSYNEQVRAAKRPEEIGDSLYIHIWSTINNHLNTSASSFSELVEQMGVARFGRRPKVADVFSGSGQIPFEAARLGCDVYASDLNPIACMLTWGDFNVIGASAEKRSEIEKNQKILAKKIQEEVDELGVESDGKGWRAKAFLYCLETKCPESGWLVPLLPNLIVNRTKGVILKLEPDAVNKRYDIKVISTTSNKELDSAKKGTISSGELVHSPDGLTEYRVKIKTIRGDYRENNENKSKLRMWEKSDFIPRSDDIYQERLYCIQWMKKKPGKSNYFIEYRTVTDTDEEREEKVINYVRDHLGEWQAHGYIPDTRIESGYNTDQPIRERGWTHWHHLFNPRQLHILGIINKHTSKYAEFTVMFPAMLNLQSKLCAWHNDGRKGGLQNVFSNQALNTLYNYGSRGLLDIIQYLNKVGKTEQVVNGSTWVQTSPAQDINVENDIYITDPPYGDAVKYEEITEFFISWLHKSPPKEFADWTWDSRRTLAIKGEDEGFRQGMILAYRQMGKMMPDNGIQVLMFTHQSGTIWADMASIIWASGLQVTAAWYVVTETDSALRQGSNVKGTVILVLRKRHKESGTFRDDLGWEIKNAVKEQVESLVGLDEAVRLQGNEGLYTDADLQMAGYAAALKVLTAYSKIDGKNMVVESEAPRQKGKKTFVDEMIEFAVQTAVQFLVPVGFDQGEWQNLEPVERFYLKMIEMEHQGANTLDNYQNFAKAFGVRNFDQLLSENSKANSARLKMAIEMKGSMMSGGSEISDTLLRALLYAIFELSKDIEIDDVLAHLIDNSPSYLANRTLMSKMADYIAEKRETLKSTKLYNTDQEASLARILSEAIRNHRL